MVVISRASTYSIYMLFSKLPHRGYYLILPPFCNINLWDLIGLLQNHGVRLGVALYKMTGREHGLTHTCLDLEGASAPTRLCARKSKREERTVGKPNN